MATEQHEMRLRERVLPHTSDRDGHLEDQTLDLDARTMQIMGKRQELRVGSSLQPQEVLALDALMLRLHQRTFGSVSITSFATTVLVSWPAIATLLILSLLRLSETDHRHH